MKALLASFFVIITLSFSHGQTAVEKTIPIKANQKLILNFDYPDVKLETWDKSEVLVKGTVSINRGENDSAFELQVESTGTEVKVTSAIKDKESIPQHVVIKKDDREYFFKAKDFNDPEVKKFIEENGGEYTYISSGIVKEIRLSVYVPKNISTDVVAKYGLVEVKNFQAPLAIDSKYGGVDATIIAAASGQITARTRHGEILTNLDLKFDQAPWSKQDKWTEIRSKSGNGPSATFESKYGNVYLRKPN